MTFARNEGNMISLLANVGIYRYSLEDFLIYIVLFAVGVGIVYAVLCYCEIPPPPIVIKLFWFIVVAILAILAIRVLFSL